jgi:hypothetical protein
MVFLSLRAAWLRRQRAKKQLTNAKNNLIQANNRYKQVKRKNNAQAPPPRQGTNYGVMRMVRVKGPYGINSIGMTNNAFNNFKRTHKYNNRGYYVSS